MTEFASSTADGPGGTPGTLYIFIVLFSVLGFGCTEESSSEDETLRDRGILIDANIDAFIIDARPREVEDTGTDAEIEAAVCFKDEGSLRALSTHSVEPGADKLITRFDLNGDSVPEMIVRSKQTAAFTFTVYAGLELNVLGTFTVPGDTAPDFMKSDHLDVPIARPIPYAARSALYTIQRVRTKRSSSLLMPKTTLRLTESRFLGLRYPSLSSRAKAPPC